METPPQNFQQPPSPADYSNSADDQQLKLLSIFYYIMAGLSACGGAFGILYIVLGGAVAAAPQSSVQGATPAQASAVFMGIGGFILILCLLVAALDFMVARGLAQRKSLTLIYIVAGLTCLSVPIGTALGIFTFVVLGRPSVQAQFKR